jgi:hypothetical protein
MSDCDVERDIHLIEESVQALREAVAFRDLAGPALISAAGLACWPGFGTTCRLPDLAVAWLERGSAATLAVHSVVHLASAR